jgi:hypothetical protein
MLRDTHGKIILDTLLSKVDIDINDPKKEPKNKIIKFDNGKPIYIGLLNVLPTPNHDRQYDPDSSIPYYFREPGPTPGSTYSEYIRIRIDTNSQLNNIFLLSDATYDESTGEVYVTNVDSILFPEAFGESKNDGTGEGTGWGDIQGFGLFYTADTSIVNTEDSLPFLWGEIKKAGTNEPITIDGGEVPVIREGGLRISIK